MISLLIEFSEFAHENLTNADHADAIADAYPEHKVEADYIYSAGRPAVLYPIDRAEPAEEAEIEIILNTDDEAMKIIAQISNKVRMETHKISDSLYHLYLGLVDHLNTWQSSEEAFELVLAAESAKADSYDEYDEGCHEDDRLNAINL